MKYLLLTAALGITSIGQAFAQDMSPQDFVNEAGSGGMFEVQSSELALENAQGEAIKAFAEMMIADHGPNNEELKTIAEAEGLSVPTEIKGANAENMQAVQEATAENFDQIYAERQVAAHEAAVALYQQYSESGGDGPLVDYANKSLPVLQQHLEDAKGLEVQ